MQTQANICSFCKEELHPGQYHGCAEKLFSLLHSAQVKKDQNGIFDEVDNMIFQGGGVKGHAYLGVMQRLLYKNPNIFKNLKRVAGNSAGSILALCIGLNLDYDDIYTLMDMKYEELLDDGMVLKIATRTKFPGISFEYQNFKVVDVFFEGKKKITELIEKLKQNSKGDQTELENFVQDIILYYGTKLGDGWKSMAKREGFDILVKDLDVAQFITKFFILFFKSDSTIQQPNLLSVLTSGSQLKRKPANLLSSFQDPDESDLDRVIESIVKRATTSIECEKTNMNEERNSYENCVPLQNGIDFYLSQLQQPFSGKIESKDELQDKVLHCALAEMLWFIFITQSDASGQGQKLGLFTGKKIQEELLEGAIKRGFEKFHRLNKYKVGFTFQELYDFTDDAGNKLFKPFYVTAFNPLDQTTDVFSVEHTPNAVAAEAVRASMSIPVFFQPVIVTENGLPKQAYTSGQSANPVGEIVRYMDGGILDNYPLFLFDDLKYCVAGEFPKWEPQRKFAIQNPRTFGFRLLRTNTIAKYKQPYFNMEQQIERKKLVDQHDTDKIGFVLRTLIGATFSSENEFLKYGNCPRSVFVSDLGFSTTDFNLSKDDKDALISSGKAAVDDYESRAKYNFEREGEKYVSEVP